MIDSEERLGERPKIVDSPNIIRSSLIDYLEITSLLISIRERRRTSPKYSSTYVESLHFIPML
jgi:hypothetical protein